MSKPQTKERDDEFEGGTPAGFKQSRRPLKEGETVPPIPSIYEQLDRAGSKSRNSKSPGP